MSSKVYAVEPVNSGVLVWVEHEARDSFSHSVLRAATRALREMRPARIAYDRLTEFAYRDEEGTDPGRTCHSLVLYITNQHATSQQIRQDLYGALREEFHSDPWYGWKWSNTGQGMI